MKKKTLFISAIIILASSLFYSFQKSESSKKYVIVSVFESYLQEGFIIITGESVNDKILLQKLVNQAVVNRENMKTVTKTLSDYSAIGYELKFFSPVYTSGTIYREYILVKD